MKNLTVTTFNVLNRVEHIEERYTKILAELDEHQSEVALLQEVRRETLGLLEDKAVAQGWWLTKGFMSKDHKDSSKVYGNMILTRKEPKSFTPIFFDEDSVQGLVVEVEGALFFNSHLAWGSFAEQKRLESAIQLNHLAEEYQQEHPNSLIISGGDFNTLPESSTLRYLKGLEAHPPWKPGLNTLHNTNLLNKISTTWTSAWDIFPLFPTARKTGGWAEETAKSVGISRPDLLPDRTIDYLMSYGWNYGEKGCPVRMEKFGVSTLDNGYGLSDHYGITVEFLN
jgi:exonuclease III